MPPALSGNVACRMAPSAFIELCRLLPTLAVCYDAMQPMIFASGGVNIRRAPEASPPR